MSTGMYAKTATRILDENNDVQVMEQSTETKRPLIPKDIHLAMMHYHPIQDGEDMIAEREEEEDELWPGDFNWLDEAARTMEVNTITAREPIRSIRQGQRLLAKTRQESQRLEDIAQQEEDRKQNEHDLAIFKRKRRQRRGPRRGRTSHGSPLDQPAGNQQEMHPADDPKLKMIPRVVLPTLPVSIQQKPDDQQTPGAEVLQEGMSQEQLVNSQAAENPAEEIQEQAQATYVITDAENGIDESDLAIPPPPQIPEGVLERKDNVQIKGPSVILAMQQEKQAKEAERKRLQEAQEAADDKARMRQLQQDIQVLDPPEDVLHFPEQAKLMKAGILSILEFKMAQETDPGLDTYRQWAKDPKNVKFSEIKGILFKHKKDKKQIRALLPKALFKHLLHSSHFNNMAAHRSVSQIVAKTKDMFYVPNIKQITRSFQARCYYCATFKERNNRKHKLYQNPVARFPRQTWSVDYAFGFGEEDDEATKAAKKFKEEAAKHHRSIGIQTIPATDVGSRSILEAIRTGARPKTKAKKKAKEDSDKEDEDNVYNKPYRGILIFLDNVSLMCTLIPVRTKQSGEFIQILKDRIISPFGYFENLRSDSESGIASKEVQDFLELHGMQHYPTAHASPQGNGKVETYIAKLKQQIAMMYAQNARTSWVDMLLPLQTAHNRAPIIELSSANKSLVPEEVFFGVAAQDTFNPVSIVDDTGNTTEEYSDYIARTAKEYRKHAVRRLDMGQRRRLRSANRGRISKQLEPKQLVWLKDVDIHRDRSLQAKYAGPHEVVSTEQTTAVLKNCYTGDQRKCHFRHIEPVEDVPQSVGSTEPLISLGRELQNIRDLDG